MDRKKLKDRIAGCWLGKGIGGTVGMPFEGCKGPISFSLNQMSGHVLPNDDLDLQLLWLKVFKENLKDTHILGDYEAAPLHLSISSRRSRNRPSLSPREPSPPSVLSLK